MNIFYLSEDVNECAVMHADKHCVKMMIEYAQLLCTAHRVLDGDLYYDLTKSNRKIKRWKLHSDKEDVLYKATHINHPSSVWVRQSKANYEYLYKLWCNLNHEFMYRYGHDKPHESYRKLHEALQDAPSSISNDSFTQPTPAMPDDVKSSCSIVSYRNYYIKHKQHLASWKMRDVPYWFNFESINNSI